MKKILLSAFIVMIFSIVGNAQCDKKILITSSKTEFLDGSGTVQRTEDEKTTIEISKTEISIIPGDRPMGGTVKFESCKWTKPFKEGKMVLKSAITDQGGDTKNVTITIESKEGKIYLTFAPDDTPDKIIRVIAEKFEEKK